MLSCIHIRGKVWTFSHENLIKLEKFQKRLEKAGKTAPRDAGGDVGVAQPASPSLDVLCLA